MRSSDVLEEVVLGLIRAGEPTERETSCCIYCHSSPYASGHKDDCVWWRLMVVMTGITLTRTIKQMKREALKEQKASG